MNQCGIFLDVQHSKSVCILMDMFEKIFPSKAVSESNGLKKYCFSPPYLHPKPKLSRLSAALHCKKRSSTEVGIPVSKGRHQPDRAFWICCNYVYFISRDALNVYILYILWNIYQTARHILMDNNREDMGIVVNALLRKARTST